MSQTRSLRRRLITTPMRDWIRGRLTGRMDLGVIYDAADLPGAALQLVQQVVKRTRLHQLEKAEVAHELIAHFRDALEAGQSVEQAVADFGDPRNAAKLIRRAKKRGRSFAAKLWWRGWQAVGVLVLLYIVAAIVLALDRPVVTVDYVAKLNAPIEAVPEQDRAWPDYRRAILALGMTSNKDAPLWIIPDPEQPAQKKRVKPGDPQWPTAAAFLRDHADALVAIRRGAGKPALGLTIGHDGHWSGDDVLALFGPDHVVSTSFDDSYAGQLVDGSLVTVLLPYLGRMRALGRVMVSDLWLAIEDGDGQRVIEDINAILGMAGQLRPGGILIDQLVGLSLAAKANEQLAGLLQHHADLFNNGQWAELAHCLARLDDWDRFHMQAEDWMFKDFVQRIYGRTGCVTLTGMRVYAAYLDQSDSLLAELGGGSLNTILTPISAVVIAPRDDLLAKHRELMQMMQHDAHRSLRDIVQQPLPIEDWFMSIGPIRYRPLLALTPALDAAQRTVLQARTARRVVMIAIAAELYRRDTGSYPADVEALVPHYLPQAYKDPSATSGTLLLKVIDGQLTIYGRGLDDDDDGGVPPKDYVWPTLNKDQTAGDWVLYPVPQDD